MRKRFVAGRDWNFDLNRSRYGYRTEVGGLVVGVGEIRGGTELPPNEIFRR